MPSLSNGTESPLFEYVASHSPRRSQIRIDLVKGAFHHHSTIISSHQIALTIRMYVYNYYIISEFYYKSLNIDINIHVLSLTCFFSQ